MNCLAHIFLSGNDAQLMMGNFIADYVKGNRKDAYPERIRQGIELHRRIDSFTDTHPVSGFSRQRLRATQGKYAGVVVDLLYDHFLARNFSDYSHHPFKKFCTDSFARLAALESFMPAEADSFYRHMVRENWLYSYRTIEGLDMALKGLSRRVLVPNKMYVAVKEIEQHYDAFESDFRKFFPQLLNFTTAYIENPKAAWKITGNVLPRPSDA